MRLRNGDKRLLDILTLGNVLFWKRHQAIRDEAGEIFSAAYVLPETKRTSNVELLVLSNPLIYKRKSGAETRI